MAVSIKSHRLYVDNKATNTVASPHTGGKFDKIPKIIVMHYTYGASATSSANWFKNPQSKASAHIVIDRDGTIIQCVPFDKVAWHAGVSSWHGINGLNGFSIGIELANWGYLKSAGSGWSSYTNVPIASPVLAMHKNGNPDKSITPIGWEPYPEAQFQAAIGVARALVETYGMNEIVGHDDIAPTRKWDPGPAFAMARFRDQVFLQRGSFGSNFLKVAVESGLNLRKGAGTGFDIIKLLPNGTLLAPHEEASNWVFVSVLDAAGNPNSSGWVHSAYVQEA